MSRLAQLFATGLGLGRSPIMPGTVGTLLAFILMPVIDGTDCPVVVYLIICAVAYISADIEGKARNDHDHSSIVCDEIIGIIPPLWWFPNHWLFVFVLFRMLDIIKPWPISWIDQHVKGAFGCLLDDVIAGLFTAIILYVFTLLL